MTVSEKFTFFYANRTPFSQWYPRAFVVDGETFGCAEQYMMLRKARVFGDVETAAKIMEAAHPRDQKALGREVRGFDEEVWRGVREAIVMAGNYAKFSQHADLRAALFATVGTTLAEANPNDRIWGIGLDETDLRTQHRMRWRGLNLLGEILTRVRDKLLVEVG